MNNATKFQQIAHLSLEEQMTELAKILNGSSVTEDYEIDFRLWAILEKRKYNIQSVKKFNRTNDDIYDKKNYGYVLSNISCLNLDKENGMRYLWARTKKELKDIRIRELLDSQKNYKVLKNWNEQQRRRNIADIQKEDWLY